MAGGLKIGEPAADLAAAAALVSSLTGSRLPADTVFFGEIGLSGAIRPVVHAGLRLKEAAKLGFAGAVAPAPARDGEAPAIPALACGHIASLVADIAAGSTDARERPRQNQERPRPQAVRA